MAADDSVPIQAPAGRFGKVLLEATKRFKRCAEWEATARQNFLNDYKFRHGDAYNGFQWPNRIRDQRELDSRPCLTMNVVKQHNLQIINEAKQNKSAIAMRATGNGATKKSADVFAALTRQIEYDSDAQQAYATAQEYQVDGGWGYWRVVCQYEDSRTFNQVPRICRVWDPLSIYLDPDCRSKDKSDAKFGFVFDMVPDEELEEAYPGLVGLYTKQPLLSETQDDSWNVKDHTRICEYFRKEYKRDVLISFMDPGSAAQNTGPQRKEILKSQLPPEVFQQLKSEPLSKWRDTQVEVIEWYLIIGQQVVDDTIWPGKYIPLIKIVGEETVIEGRYDCKGHTRSMLDSQRMYNYNAALALNTPIPTPTGWTTMGQLEAGSWVFDGYGKPVQVKKVLDIRQDEPSFEISFTDGSKITSDAGHIWKVEERGKRKAAGWEWKSKTVSTSELTKGKHFIRLAEPLDLAARQLTIDPYLLGSWLGDGDKNSLRITCHEDDVEEQAALLNELGYSTKIADHAGRAKTLYIHGVRAKFAEANLLGDKHIPWEYLRGSKEQRLSLLQGLMDTDGHYAATVNQCVFVNTDAGLLAGFSELLSSLGIKFTVDQVAATTKKFPGEIERDCQRCFHVQFTADPDMPVFRLARKKIQQTASRKIHWRRTKRVGVEAITEVASVPVRCITLDTPEHLFLAGRRMLPTHNSAQVEFVALQSKSPWVAAAEAIEEYESYWNTANLINHSVLPYNGLREDGTAIQPPQKPAAPQQSPAFQQGMTDAFNQMMMTSGQWQNQMGMMGNERTGDAIARRQAQSFTAVYHFADNYAMGLRLTGKMLIDLIPKIYDRPRLMRLRAEDGEDFDLEIDPTAKQAYMEQLDEDGEVVRRVLNPQLGKYDVEADVGPAYGTRREETADTLKLLLTQAPQLTVYLGDLLLRALNIKESEEAAARLKRMVPAQALGKGPTQAEAQLKQQVISLQSALAEALQKSGEQRLKLIGKEEMRDIDVYEAETKRISALAKQLPTDAEGLQQLIHQLVEESLGTHLTPIIEANSDELEAEGAQPGALPETPPMLGAKKAPDGHWYINHPEQKGKFLRVGRKV